jgi:DUF1680 family protein
VDDARIDPRTELRPVPGDGVVTLVADGARVAAPDAAWPYGKMGATVAPESLELIPYAWWGNRGEAGMRVWLPVSP